MEMNSAPVTLNGQVWISNGKKSNWKWELDLSWTRIISLRCCPFPGGLRCVIVVSETAEVCPSGTRTPCECVVAVGKREGKKIPTFVERRKSISIQRKGHSLRVFIVARSLLPLNSAVCWESW